MEPGAPLPSERHLCDLLRVNRGAIREALKRLEQAGLVTIQHGGGARVLNYRHSGNLDLLTRLLFHSDGTIDLGVARSTMEMRAAMAPDIARLCAKRRQPQHLHQLFEVVAAMADHPDDLPALQSLALQFWDVLVDGSDNIAYQLVFNSLREAYDRLRELLVEVLATELRDLAAYRAIAEAIHRSDDLSAAAVAQTLMNHGSSAVFQLLAALADDPTDNPTTGGDEDGRPS